MGADPLNFLPVPTTATDLANLSGTNGLVDHFYDVVVDGVEPVTLAPGVYHNGISISSDVDVTFLSGIYVLANGNGLNISGGGIITGEGVMFYNTGHDFDVNTGYPDTLDGPAYDGPNNPTGSNFGQINLGGNGSWNFTPLNDPNSPFSGMLIYQRRVNTKKVNISGNADFNGLEGMVYAKWTEVYVSGNGEFSASFIAGRFHVSGNGGFSIGPFGDGLLQIAKVYLVE